MHPAALLAVNHGAHVRGLHTHNPSLTPVIHFQLQSCSTRPLCQLIHTKTSIFYSYTHTLTHTQCSTPGSRRRELGSVPRSPRTKSSQTSSRHRAGWWAERTWGAAFLHRHSFPGEGQGLSIPSCPRTEGHWEPVTHEQATVSGGPALSWDIPHVALYLASCPSCNIWVLIPLCQEESTGSKK